MLMLTGIEIAALILAILSVVIPVAEHLLRWISTSTEMDLNPLKKGSDTVSSRIRLTHCAGISRVSWICFATLVSYYDVLWAE